MNTDKVKAKLLTNLRTFVSEHQLTYLASPKVLVGYNLVLDPLAKNLDKYDWGLTWQPAAGAFVGLKHESTSKDTLQLGKFFLYFHHYASAAQTVGTEFSLDWQKKVVSARLGLAHKFNEETSGKLKVNQEGELFATLKHKINNNVTAGLTSGFSVSQVITQQKAKKVPLGVSLDLKL